MTLLRPKPRKRPQFAKLGFCFCIFTLFPTVAVTSSAQQAATPAPTSYSVISRSMSQRIWQRSVNIPSPSGQAVPQTQQYTELSDGICYFRDGSWFDTQNQIEVSPDGSAASATNGPTQVSFPPDLGGGVITLISPEGLQIQEQPAALCYDDGSNTIILAVLTNSVCQLTDTNEITYTNAFLGLNADAQYRYKNGGLEQNVILHERPPDPGSLGLNPQTTSLELLSQFIDAPQPAITSINVQTSLGEVSDENLQFGSIRMIPGKAFLLGANQQSVSVTKQWLQLDGRQFLAESVPVSSIADQLSTLPAAVLALSPRGKLRVLLASVHPERRLARKTASRILPSKAAAPTSGLAIDFVTVTGSLSNYVFQGSSTYYISSELTLNGTNIFEGGSVIKFAPSGPWTFYSTGPSIEIEGSNQVNWSDNQYRPVIFTARDDNTVGNPVSGSTGNPSGYYGDPMLNIDSAGAQTISNFRFAWAEQGVIILSSAVKLYDGQFVNCLNGITGGYADTFLGNVLFANVLTNFDDFSEVALVAENVTFSGSACLWGQSAPGSFTFGLTNCILANVTNLDGYASSVTNIVGEYNGSFSAPTISMFYYLTYTNPFEVIGGGLYLTNGVFRENGTANIDPALLADIEQRTTYPPTVYDRTNISYLGILNPDVPRDTNATTEGVVDLGYHHAPLDYVFGGCDLYSNLTIAAGTAVGWFQDTNIDFAHDGFQPYAISLNDGANLSLNGTASQPCYFADYVMVQEGENNNWTNSGYFGGIVFNGTNTSQQPILSGDFTQWSMDSDCCNFFRDSSAYSTFSRGAGSFKNCEFYNGIISTYEMEYLNFTNCLFYQDVCAFWDPWYALSYTFVNCTFYDGGLVSARYNGDIYTDTGLSSSFWLIENCSFDGTTFEWSDCLNANSANTLFDYNAYNTNNLSWTNNPVIGAGNGTNEVVAPNDLMTGDYGWQRSYLGNFYLPPNSALITNGSTAANLLGLYWFTTQTNQSIESNNIVDIGYAYVATDTNGSPLDYYVPQIPNYILNPDGPPTNLLVIVSQPTNQTVMQGSNATLSLTVEAIPSASYQWFWNGQPLSDAGGVSGSSGAGLNLSGVQPDQAGNYTVVVTNSSGSVTSTPSMLTVLPSQTSFLPPQWLLSQTTYWTVTDVSDPGQPVSIGELQEPFSEGSYNFAGNGIPSFNTPWHTTPGSTSTMAYGVTYRDGEYNLGTVFSLSIPDGALATLHSFAGTGGNEGANPCSELAVSGGNFWGISNALYGTTYDGGSNGYGTVFKVNTDGTGFTNLYNFTGGNDGRFPQTGLLIDGSTLYGTTSNSIFKINIDGSDFTCLINTNGASQLILSPAGNILYGTISNAGTASEGMLFSISTAGTNFTDIYNFTGGTYGAFPASGLELYGLGNSFSGSNVFTLYGTTYGGGKYGRGTIFSINTDGTGFADRVDFDGTNDGANPVGGLLITNENIQVRNAGDSITTSYLFGTTSTGGTNGGGTIWGLSLNPSGSFETLYSFSTNAAVDPANPAARLAVFDNVLFGTTSKGGAFTNGVIFSINNAGTNFTDIYDFAGTNDGGSPLAGLALPVSDNLVSIWSLETTINVSAEAVSNIMYFVAVDNLDALFVNGTLVSYTNEDGDATWAQHASLSGYVHEGQNDVRVIIGGDPDVNDYFTMAINSPITTVIPANLFGTTFNGGSNSDGTVFEITTNGQEKILHAFKSSDGANPIGDLILSSNTLYGVTQAGGTNDGGNGTIFRINTDSTGFTNLYEFGSASDGANPAAGLILSGTTLYGATQDGGSNSDGTVFRIQTDGTGYTNLYTFSGYDGRFPEAPLLLISNTLYGTTFLGGTNGVGTIFSIRTDGSNFEPIYSFGSSVFSDGQAPMAGLTLCGSTLYGTTKYGGTCCGTVFSYNLTNPSPYQIVYNFTGPPGDGTYPEAGLILFSNTLFGTTFHGGDYDSGTIFSIPAGGPVAGDTIYQNLGSIDTSHAQYPQSDLIMLGGSLYGTTPSGGAHGFGMVFSINTNGPIFNDVYDFTNGSDGQNPQGGVCSP